MVSLCSSCQKVYDVTTNDLQQLFTSEQLAECSQPQSFKTTDSTMNTVTRDSTDVECSRESNCSSANEEERKSLICEQEPSISRGEDMKITPPLLERAASLECNSCVQPDPKRAKFSDQDFPCALEGSDKACTMCLGLLDRMFFATLTTCIVDELDRAQYSGLEKFSLAIHTPLSLLIRQKGVLLFAQTINPADQTYPDEQYVKEELREILKLALSKKLSQLTFSVDSPFQIIIKFTHERSNQDCKLLQEMKPNAFPRPKRRGRRRLPNSTSINNVSITRALEGITVEDFIQNKSLLLAVDKECSYEVEFLHSSLFVAGRYNKYSRHLPQTPWVVEGVKKAETSVEELISPQLLALTLAASEKFSASGREDVDVRMLGNGRPFVLELLNPRKVVITEEELFEASEMINKSTDLVAVRQLKLITKQSLSLIKEGEEEKRKRYCAVIWVENDITPSDLKTIASIKDLKIAQKTPIRVIHRRTLATREKIIYSMDTKFIDAHHFKLYLCTQAGTYIKEFIHGDFGRTVPNLGTLLRENVDILTLDVEVVELVWPPS